MSTEAPRDPERLKGNVIYPRVAAWKAHASQEADRRVRDISAVTLAVMESTAGVLSKSSQERKAQFISSLKEVLTALLVQSSDRLFITYHDQEPERSDEKKKVAALSFHCPSSVTTILADLARRNFLASHEGNSLNPDEFFIHELPIEDLLSTLASSIGFKDPTLTDFRPQTVYIQEGQVSLFST